MNLITIGAVCGIIALVLLLIILLQMACLSCGDTREYTDPNLIVRCVRCFKWIPNGTPGVPMGRMVNDEEYRPI